MKLIKTILGFNLGFRTAIAQQSISTKPTTTTISPQSTGSAYLPQVIGGNESINKHYLRFNGTSNLVITFSPYAPSDKQVQIQYLNGSFYQTQPSSTQALKLALAGPSGRGYYHLIHGASTADPSNNCGFSSYQGIGSVVRCNEWQVKEVTGSYEVLRYTDDTCTGHWFAEKSVQDGLERWVVTWYEVLSGQLGLLSETAVPIDIQLLRV